MTIIPDDDTYSGERRPPAQRIDEAGQGLEDSARRIAAAIQGALEGFVEALDEYDLANEGKRAVQEAGEIARAAGTEARAQGQTPEMQELKGQLQTAGAATADAARSATESVKGVATDVKDDVAERYETAKEGVRERAESVKYAAVRTKEEVKVRAQAVAETGRRARVAPGRIRQELSAGFSAWKRGLLTSLAMFAALAVFATTALVVLTIALVVGLNELLGDPAGTFVVALIYVIVAGIAFAVARSARARAAEETQERMENAREEMRHVGRPVRDAFSRGRTGI